MASVAAGLDSDNVDIRLCAVLALAELPGDETTVELTSALDDPDATGPPHRPREWHMAVANVE
ncbi:hypothetical protein ABTW96_33695 [Nocardia beijingensis]|uniref:hypothetical protein n=1 Tax=Nocardia beijingensis TaxID=95162 RepID=UPI003318A19E